ncbi:hypothetical protein LOK49_LG14G02161 [Camellia lanceoleosa]|uniref:Uncharacterized protein n=1 Tax=Camellia lanceoleosa TaxID=1840588 RepID=A0ACC0FCF6_9ERIC|nr:hypothetical protein LOK49_LG14G02161 [Camellia lanceoleosa]
MEQFLVNYKLRDWLFARQRYWGEPILVVFLKDTSDGVPLPESELPLALPELDDFTPTGTGEPPLSKAVSWFNSQAKGKRHALDSQIPFEYCYDLRECLKLIPHEKFSFAKIGLLATQFEIRQLNLNGARLILGNAIGKAPKDKVI